MSNLRAKAVLIGNEVHIAGNQDQWGRGGQGSATAGSAQKPVYGVVDFVQQGNEVVVTGKIEGLTQNTQHGFHIHEFGDVTNVSSVKHHACPTINKSLFRAVHLPVLISIHTRNPMPVQLMPIGMR